VKHGLFCHYAPSGLSCGSIIFTLDLIKEKLTQAYKLADEAQMATKIIEIMDICQANGNPHL